MRQVRPVVASPPVPCRRAARRADRAWISEGLGSRSSTTTGRPKPDGRCIAHTARRGGHAAQVGSPSSRLRLRRQAGARRTGEERRERKGRACIVPPLPPGCMTTIWGDDERFVKTYLKRSRQAGLHDVRLGHARRGRLLLRPRPHRRRDQRRGPSSRHARNRGSGAVASEHRRSRRRRRGRSVKGQVPVAFVVVRDADRDSRARRRMRRRSWPRWIAARRHRAAGARAFRDGAAEDALGQAAAPRIQALAEGRDPGDLTTIEDPGALMQVREALGN